MIEAATVIGFVRIQRPPPNALRESRCRAELQLGRPEEVTRQTVGTSGEARAPAPTVRPVIPTHVGGCPFRRTFHRAMGFVCSRLSRYLLILRIPVERNTTDSLVRRLPDTLTCHGCTATRVL